MSPPPGVVDGREIARRRGRGHGSNREMWHVRHAYSVGACRRRCGPGDVPVRPPPVQRPGAHRPITFRPGQHVPSWRTDRGPQTATSGVSAAVEDRRSTASDARLRGTVPTAHSPLEPRPTPGAAPTSHRGRARPPTLQVGDAHPRSRSCARVHGVARSTGSTARKLQHLHAQYRSRLAIPAVRGRPRGRWDCFQLL